MAHRIQSPVLPRSRNKSVVIVVISIVFHVFILFCTGVSMIVVIVVIRHPDQCPNQVWTGTNVHIIGITAWIVIGTIGITMVTGCSVPGTECPRH